ncbi:hypothetical protein RND81_10G227200 [Saponaria officinalis]|uniref:CASP-like protein n=1 Tax=Saponaria officinalis TaxID=3572 RepID=A0AAW1I600_SAPOF
MQKNINHLKPPRAPPLAVSLPSPTRPEPARPDDPPHDSFPKTDTALVAVEKYYSPLTSPLPATPPKDATVPENFPPPQLPLPLPLLPTHQIVNYSRREEPPLQYGGVYGGGVVGGGGERKVRGAEAVVRGSKKEEVVKKVNLGIRVLEFVLCLISLSVMAADKTQGWSGDSFDRYKEYRFCLSVAVLGFVYSALQAYDVGSHLATDNCIPSDISLVSSSIKGRRLASKLGQRRVYTKG